MTPCYKCKWVITGMSTNKGAFREEGTTSMRRYPPEVRDEAELREEVRQSLLSYLSEHERTPWRPEPRYANVSNLKIDLDVIEVAG